MIFGTTMKTKPATLAVIQIKFVWFRGLVFKNLWFLTETQKYVKLIILRSTMGLWQFLGSLVRV